MPHPWPPSHSAFSLSADLQHINSARQRCITGEARGKSLSTNWARGKSFCRQIVVVHHPPPRICLSFFPVCLSVSLFRKHAVLLISIIFLFLNNVWFAPSTSKSNIYNNCNCPPPNCLSLTLPELHASYPPLYTTRTCRLVASQGAFRVKLTPEVRQ